MSGSSGGIALRGAMRSIRARMSSPWSASARRRVRPSARRPPPPPRQLRARRGPGRSAAGGRGRAAHAQRHRCAGVGIAFRHEGDWVDLYPAQIDPICSDGEHAVADAHGLSWAPRRPDSPRQLQAQGSEERPWPGHEQPSPGGGGDVDPARDADGNCAGDPVARSWRQAPGPARDAAVSDHRGRQQRARSAHQ